MKYNLKYIDKINLKNYEEQSQKSHFLDKNLEIFEFKNATVLPLKHSGYIFYNGGVLDENFNIIEESKIYPDRLLEAYKFNKDEIIIENKEVIYIGAFWAHWGHFLIEQISRLYYFLNETTTKNLPIIYTATRPLEGVFLEFFELLEIDIKRLIWIDKPTKFKKIYMPEVSTIAGEHYTKEYAEIFEKIKNNQQIPNFNYEKVFYTTKNFRKNPEKSFGELEKIENMFEKSDYKIISPEKLTLKEQIGIIKNCKEFASIEGTLPHNLLFANKDIKATIINKIYSLNPFQLIIDEITQIKPTYIDCHLSLFPNEMGFGMFYYHISDNLKNYAKDNDFEIPTEDLTNLKSYFKKYSQRYLAKKKYFSPEEYEKFSTYLFYINKIKNPFLKLEILIYSFILCTPFLRTIFEKIKIHTDKFKRKLRLIQLTFEISFRP